MFVVKGLFAVAGFGVEDDLVGLVVLPLAFVAAFYQADGNQRHPFRDVAVGGQLKAERSLELQRLFRTECRFEACVQCGVCIHEPSIRGWAVGLAGVWVPVGFSGAIYSLSGFWLVEESILFETFRQAFKKRDRRSNRVPGVLAYCGIN